ncbi:N-acetylmuramoyl-L-alanine amidase family protein [Saprospira grandis]|uniref:N-acetylmuramoyl-L-alanine amidase n=1 Tax=Saprospira grandis (strain Lewin) TaxID=984262 RepID=H6L2M9_SAPGL|nr:N-acetylmuramoyl-L-alanine amidase [Saprospira grandis]AFC24786.1 cell wall hydrolase/autolysin [Saprospira grandis str. Lewin]
MPFALPNFWGQRPLFSLFLLLFYCFLPQIALEKEGPAIKSGLRTIVIDAGHGGKDNGSSGAKAKEKEVALKIALKLGGYIKKYLPDVKVVYTRSTDVFVPLHERSEIANRLGADLFISVHCNSLPKHKKNIQGTETFVMGLHRAKENLDVAKRENRVVLLEDNYQKRYGGYDPNSPEGHIMLSMYQNAYLSQSVLLAEKIQAQFKERVGRKSRGVKQAGFVVLRASNMPSVLVETGFLSNAAEEKYLNSDKGQAYLASAIFRAIRSYKKIIDKGNGYQANNLQLRVQLGASPKPIAVHKAPWSSVEELEEEQEDGLYKYLTGNYPSMLEAVKAQRFWRSKGFDGAFVVAYKNGKRISLAEARSLLAN